MEKSHLLRRLLLWAACCSVCAVPVTVCAENEFHLGNELSITTNDVSGPVKAQSSLTKGARYLDVLNFYGNGRSNQLEYGYTIGGKATDDQLNDSKTFSLTNFQGRFSNKVHTLVLGDTFESFSQYSLNTAVKGGAYKFTANRRNTPEVTLLYGLAYSRWDNLWTSGAMERQVIGGRIRQSVGDDFSIALSGVQTIDHMGMPGLTLYDGHTFTLDAEYRPIPGLTLRSEASFSNYGKTETGAYSTSDGNAVRFEAVGDADPSRVSLEYERITPGYVTIAGSATPDREKVKARWRYKYTKNVTYNFGFLWFHDSIFDQKADRTDHYKPEVGVSIKRPFGRQYAVADVTYKLDTVYNSTTTTNDHFINFTYRDRFGIFDSDSNFSIALYDTTDSRRAQEYTYNTSLSSRHTVGPVILKPVFYFGGWTANEELAIARTTDYIFEYSGGLGVEVPTWKVTSSWKIGENRLLKEAAGDTMKTYGQANIYWRPEFAAKTQGMLFVRAFINDYRYSLNSANAENFRENSVTVGANFLY